MTILGVNAFHGDAAAAVIRDGRLLCAVAEERWTRRKHDGGFPLHAIRWCREQCATPPDAIAIGRSPRAHVVRKLCALVRYPSLWRHAVTRHANALAVRSLSEALSAVLGQQRSPIFVEHHRAHLTHAYVTGPSRRSALLSIDGFGDFVSLAWGWGRDGDVRILHRTFFPHSLGLLYTAVTQLLGFDRYGEEYKVMALAAYGEPRQREQFRRLIRPTPDGFALHPAFFEHTRRGVPMSFGPGTPDLGRVYSKQLPALLGPPRAREEPLTARHYDLAASLQAATEDIILHIARRVRAVTGETTLALAGGVALNSVANGVLSRQRLFARLWIPSAPADDGTAIGAAASVALAHGEGVPPCRENASACLGPAYPTPLTFPLEVSAEVVSETEGVERAVEALWRGGIVGWFQGRMEFGPRALGQRSIFADPRRADVRDRLNALVKRRELFRPFAPLVLLEDAPTYFALSELSPTMMFVSPVRPEWRAKLPAITHIDGSARVQTVDATSSPHLCLLLRRWKERAGVSVLLNTSFNENEPIVNTPKEALDCFLRTPIDLLVLNDRVITKRSAAERAGDVARHASSVPSEDGP